MPGSISRWGVTGFAVALGAAAPALGQGEPLQAGAFVDGEVPGSDSPVSLSLRAAPGQTIQLDAIPAPQAPGGLDLVMKVYGPDGVLVGEDDDGGGSLNPRVTVTSEAGGLYRVEMGVLGEGGPFTLLARSSVFKPQVLTELTLADGKAERGVAFPADDDALFTFEGSRGDTYAFTLTAEDGEGEEASDPMLELFDGSGTVGPSLGQDDDSGGALNSRLVTELPRNGTYTVRVSSLSSKGRARLAISKLTLQPATVGDLAYGAEAVVQFTENSPFVIQNTDRRLAPYALFRLPATPTPRTLAGRDEAIVIRATSEELDPYLEVGFDTPFGFTTILSNDDADGLNARLTLDPAVLADGDPDGWWSKVRIRVTIPSGSTGEVRVVAERAAD